MATATAWPTRASMMKERGQSDSSLSSSSTTATSTTCSSLDSSSSSIISNSTVSFDLVQPTTSRRKKGITGGVTFQNEGSLKTVFSIPSLAEYTDNEIEDLWYTRSEREELYEDAYDVANGYNIDDDDTRGLEKHTKEGGQWAMECRKKVIMAVLQEQWRQRELGEKIFHESWELLAAVSYKVSMQSQDLAYRLAYNDELESISLLRKNQNNPKAAKAEATKKNDGGMLNAFKHLFRTA